MYILYIYVHSYTFRFSVKNIRDLFVSNISSLFECRVCRQCKKGARKKEKRSKSGDRERTGWIRGKRNKFSWPGFCAVSIGFLFSRRCYPFSFLLSRYANLHRFILVGDLCYVHATASGDCSRPDK